MEARVALLERGFEEMRASLARIEAAQAEAKSSTADLTKELRDFRREVKEVDVPAIRTSLAKVEGQMEKTPTLHQLVAIFAVMLAAAVAVTGFNLLAR